MENVIQVDRTNSLIRKTHQTILFIILFFSGISALIYQIIWIKKFGLIFGVQFFSITTVLTSFMAGLALGSLYFGRLVDRKKSALKLFFIIELGLGLFAILFPFLFKGLTNIYVLIAKNLSLNPYTVQLVRFAISFLFLLIPTTLMGGTLPVIIKFFVNKMGSLGTKISLLYAVNNLGAVLGGFVAGFFLLRNLGVSVSLYVGAGLNLFNALLAYLLSRFYSINPDIQEEKIVKSGNIVKVTDEEKVVYQLPKYVLRIVLWVFAIEGFTTLAYEVIWSRILIEFSIDKTVYFTTTIVVSFIFGLSLGSFIISKWIDKLKNLLTLLGFIEIIIGILSIGMLLLFAKISPIVSQNRSMLESWFQTIGKEYILFFVILSIPTTLMGFTYPIVSKLYAANINKVGDRMGTIGFMDTIGSILGSFVAGFIMVPFIGATYSFIIVVCINLIIGLLVIVIHPEIKNIVKSSIVGVSIVLTAILYSFIPGRNYYEWWDQLDYKNTFWGQHYDRILYFEEGLGATVSVRHYPYQEDYLALNVDGHNTAYSSKKDRRVNSLLGYLPYMLHPNPQKAAVIGFGTGVTANSLIQPEIKELDIAEICQGVINAAPYFAEWNENVFEQPNVNVYIEDGRGLIFMVDKYYDIITSNSIHPRLSNNIYTKDFYEICKSKLADGGLVCQWIPQNWLTTTEYRSLIKAFIDAFPHSQMWYINEYSTLLVGKKEPMEIDYSIIADRFENNPKLKRDMVDVGIPDPEILLSQYFYSGEELKQLYDDSPVNSDDYPLVEFSRVVNIAPDTIIMHEISEHNPDLKSVLKNFDFNDEMSKSKLNKIMGNTEFLKKHIKSIIGSVKVFEINNEKKDK